MALDPRIILAGQAPDTMGAFSGGLQTGAMQNQIGRQNALADLYRTQGAGIMAGDTGALNALAGLDPMAAMDVQKQRLGMDATRQGMQIADRRLELMNAEEKRQAEAYARGLSKEQAAAEAAKIEDAVKMGMMAPDAATYDQLMQSVAPDLVGTFAQRQILAARAMTMADVLKQVQGPDPSAAYKGAPANHMWVDPANPAAGVVPIPGYHDKPADDYQRYVEEEWAAGRQPLARLDFEQAKKGKGFTTTITNPDGTTTTFSMGGAQGGTGAPTVGQAYNPNEVESVLSMIGAIRKDPSLSRVIGPLQGGGGNNIDDLGAAQRLYYGGEGLALIEKIGQLQSNAWLSARQMLKGGGAITDYESRKAEAAVARLSRAKDPAKFVEALDELEAAIREGMAKLQGQAPAAPPAAPQSAPAAPRRLRYNPATGELE